MANKASHIPKALSTVHVAQINCSPNSYIDMGKACNSPRKPGHCNDLARGIAAQHEVTYVGAMPKALTTK